MTTASNRLASALAAGRLAITAECLPPPSADRAAVKALSEALPSSLDAVVVAENCEEIRSSALACAALLTAEGRTTVLSMVTRDRNRIALESDALGAASMGIGAILSLSGHHQSLATCPQAAGAYDIDSVQLAQALNRMRREGLGFNGRRLEPQPEMLVGAVVHHSLQPVELNLLRLRKKVAAGVDFLLTEAVEDVPGFAKWMEAIHAMQLDGKVAIIASVSAAGGADVASQLKSIPGVRGIHILSGGAEASAAAVISGAGLA